MSKVEFMSPEGLERMLELGKSEYRPPQIVALKEQIEGETRAAELNLSVTGVIDEERIKKIVRMKLELDVLYHRWSEGEIE